MTQNEYIDLLSTTINTDNSPFPIIHQLQNMSDRTLLFGRTTRRNHFHVYCKNHTIYAITYSVTWQNNQAKAKNIKNINIQDNQNYVPHTVCSERSDYEFCKRLIENGTNLPLTKWISNMRILTQKHNHFDDSIYYGYTK